MEMQNIAVSHFSFEDLVLIGPVAVLHMSLVVRKPVFGVSNEVRHKPGCTVTEDGRLEA